MPDWDYEMVWSGDGGLSGVRREIQDLAADGWEVVSTCAVTGVFVVLLRRRIATAAQPAGEEEIDLTAHEHDGPEAGDGQRRPRRTASPEARNP